MSIKSSIFTSNRSANDPESQYMNKGILPPLVSPTLPPIYDSIRDLTPLSLDTEIETQREINGSNGSNSYTWDSNKSSFVVKLSIPKGYSSVIARKDENRSTKVTDHQASSATTSSSNHTTTATETSSAMSSINKSSSLQSSKNGNVSGLILEKRKEKSDLFLGKSKHFRNAAAQKKRESDKMNHDVKDAVKSITLAIESVLVFFISFDYEDKSRLVEKKLMSDKSWITLEPYLESILKNIKENMPKNNRLKYLFAIASLLKGAQSQHLSKISIAVIKNSQLRIEKEPDSDKKDRLKHLIYENSIKLADLQSDMISNYKNFEKNLNHLEIKLNFPITFKKRSLNIDPIQKQESLKPDKDAYYIPVSMISSLQEILAFCDSIVREFKSSSG